MYSMPRRSVWLYDYVWRNIVELREQVKGLNINRLLNESVLTHLSVLDGADEVLRLGAEIDAVRADLDRMHRLQSSLLKHGSYASAYLDELVGVDAKRIVVDLPPYNRRRERPEISEDEMAVVVKIVGYREGRIKELLGKLDKLVELKAKRAGIDLSSWVGSRPEPVKREDPIAAAVAAAGGKVGPREFRERRMRTPDPEVQAAFEKVSQIDAEIRRRHDAELDAKEAAREAGEDG